MYFHKKKVNRQISLLLQIFLLTPDPNWKSFSSYSMVGQYNIQSIFFLNHKSRGMFAQCLLPRTIL